MNSYLSLVKQHIKKDYAVIIIDNCKENRNVIWGNSKYILS